jgi:hypothetical protein
MGSLSHASSFLKPSPINLANSEFSDPYSLSTIISFNIRGGAAVRLQGFRVRSSANEGARE